MTPAPSPSPRSVLYIGAGYGDGFDAGLAGAEGGGIGVVTLVEPNPEMIAELRRKTARFPRANIIEAAAGARTGRATLNVYNLPELGSLRAPTGAAELFPGLEVVDQFKVDVLAFSEILERHETDETSPNLLVIDAPGEEAALLEDAIASGAIDRFQDVTVYSGRSPLFEGGAGADAIIARLEALGFDLRDSAPDPLGRLCLRFQRSVQRAAIQSLEAERDDLRTRLEDAETNAKEAEKLRAQVAELEQQIKDAKANAKAAEELRARADEAAKELRARVDELEEQLKETKKDRAKANKRKTELEYSLQAADAQRALYEKELIQLEAQMEMIREIMALPGGAGGR